MDKISVKLMVFFEEPFWVGILEQIRNQKLSVCKITFGAEPKDYEIYKFIQKNYDSLQFSPHVATTIKKMTSNPKQAQRKIRKQVQNTAIGTKSQQALKLQHEKSKLERKVKNREQKKAEQQRQFQLKQQKKKRKHKGK